MHADPQTTIRSRRVTRRHNRRGWLLALTAHAVGVSAFVWLASHPGSVLHGQAEASQGVPIQARLWTPAALPSSVSALPATANSGLEVGVPAATPSPQSGKRTTVADSTADKPAPQIKLPAHDASQRRPHSVTVKTTRPAAPQQHKRQAPASGQVVTAVTASQTRAVQPGASAAVATVKRAEGGAMGAGLHQKTTATQHQPQGSVRAGQATPVQEKPADFDAEGGPVIQIAQYIGSPPDKEYPPLARRRGWQGTVTVEVWLDNEGEQLKREIISGSGHSELDRAALRFVAASQFAPYMFNGVGHAARLRLPVVFSLTDPA